MMPSHPQQDRKNVEVCGRRWRVLCALTVCVFFFFWMLFDGPHIAVDSRGYLNNVISREAGYPLFLALCRHLPFAAALQAEGYAGIWYATFFQSLLWAYAVYRVGIFVYDLAERAGLQERRARIIMCCAVGLQLAICLVNRFLANRRTVYSNEILTEAFTMPLFLLVTIQVFYVLRDGGRKNLLLCGLLSFCLITVRNQMQFALIAWGILLVLYLFFLPAYRNVKRGAVQIGVILLVLLCNRFADSCYHYAYHGFFGRLDTSASFFGTMMYTTNEEDAALFREGEEEEKELFLNIAKEQKARGARLDALSAEAGLFGRVSHFAENFDVIVYEIGHPLVLADPSVAAVEDDNERGRRMYAMEGAIAKIMFRQDLSDVLYVFSGNLLAALSYSVARMSPRLLPLVLLLYLLYLVLLVLCIRKNGKEGKDPGVTLFALLVLCNIIVNSLVVGFLICPSARYMSYGMAFFYTALLLMMLYLKKKTGGEADA